MNSIVSEIKRADRVPTILVEADCFHCGLPLPAGFDVTVEIDSQNQPMCCHGCEAVAQAIVNAGHEHFYRVRTSASLTGENLVPEFLRDMQIYDNPDLQKQFVHQVSDSDLGSTSSNEREISLILEGITCAACVWLNERHIANLPGVVSVQVNYATHRAWLRWDDAKIKLSEILQAIHSIGYKALPFDSSRQHDSQQRESRDQLKRLAVAGIFGMQVMMISVTLYTGAWSGMAQSYENFFSWLSLLLTLPVMLYCAPVFFRSAWKDIAHHQVGMNVPVSLAIGIAFVASAIATMTGEGQLYFDSVVMFVFFLLASRYFEWMARRRGAQSVERLAHALPVMANRLSELSEKADQETERVIASSLLVGDRLLIKPGGSIPADGKVLHGCSNIDESVLNGESRPVPKVMGDRLIGGSVNIDNPLQMEVESIGADTMLSSIQRMIDKVQSDKSPIAQLADRIASRFIIAVLLIVAIVAVFWFVTSPEHWLEIALASLIVTCPCALSLATPTVISAALSRLQGQGLLVTHGGVLDRLDQVTHVVFDKTGTLTQGEPVLSHVYSHVDGDDSVDSNDCLNIASALEAHSEHPLAKALIKGATGLPVSRAERLVATNLVNHPGGGLSGIINGQTYIIGSIDFIQQQTNLPVPKAWLNEIESTAATIVVLSSADKILSLFTLEDALRDDAVTLISKLRCDGKQVILMSGDRDSAVQKVAEQVGIKVFYSGLSPKQKMDKVISMQANKAVVLMVGDGVNDAPVLAAADVSIAMSNATSLAKTSADAVLMNNKLNTITYSLAMARRSRNNIRQNFAWALSYNFCAIPAAAMGLVMPWMAAIGMSLSSLIVVLNALRLSR